MASESECIELAKYFTRFHLGCGVTFHKGWLNINYWQHLDPDKVYSDPNQTSGTFLLNHDLRLGIPAEDNSLDAIYHSHFLEHLAYFDGLDFLQKCYDKLKVGAVHRVVVPDLEAFVRAYTSDNSFLLDKYKELVLKERAELYETKASILMGMIHNHEHKCIYDWPTLKWALERVGFRNVQKKLFQESDLLDIIDIEPYSPLRAIESLCVECYK